MSLRPFSFSKVNTFSTCPRKFKYQYIDKIPVKFVPQIHLDRGNFLHLLMEHNGDLKKVQADSDFKRIKQNKLLTKEEIKNLIKIYKDFISSPVGKSITSKRNLYKELPIGINEDFKKVEYDADDLMLRGYIDAIYVDEERNIPILCDWKSGKYKEKDKQSYQQLMYYGIALFDMIPFDKILMVYAYLEHGKINTKVLKREDLPKYKKALKHVIDEIEAEKEFPKKESGLCNYCDYQGVCMNDSDNDFNMSEEIPF